MLELLFPIGVPRIAEQYGKLYFVLGDMEPFAVAEEETELLLTLQREFKRKRLWNELVGSDA